MFFITTEWKKFFLSNCESKENGGGVEALVGVFDGIEGRNERACGRKVSEFVGSVVNCPCGYSADYDH